MEKSAYIRRPDGDLNRIIFVCKTLEDVDFSEAYKSLKWFVILNLPTSADCPKIQLRLKRISEILKSVSDEYPRASTVLRIVVSAMSQLYQERNMKNKVESKVSSKSVKRKLDFEDCSPNKRFKTISTKTHKAESSDKLKHSEKNSPEQPTTANLSDSESEGSEIETMNRERETYYSSAMIPSVAKTQAPHYGPLDGMSKEFCKPIIEGIETSFLVVHDDISGLATAEDVKCKAAYYSNHLQYLQSMGYDVGKLNYRLQGLVRLADEKFELLEASNKLSNELQKLKARREAADATQSDLELYKTKVADIQEQLIQLKKTCCWLDSEIKKDAKLPW